MNFRIFVLLLALLLLTANAKNEPEDDDNQEEQEEDEDDITTMTFLVQHQQEADNDYIQINLLIETSDSSLTNALAEATALVSTVSSIGETYCESNPEDDVVYSCNEVVDAGDFEIEAKYTTVRKQQTFSEFIVTHEITISVYHTEKIGQLADQLLKAGVSKIESFEWASTEEEDGEEGAIEAGKDKSHDMCFHLGMKLHRIVAVDMVEEEEGGDEGGDDKQQDQEQEEEEQGPLVYRFEIECILDEETAAAKQAQEQAEQAQQDDDDQDQDEDDEDADGEEQQQEEEEQEEQEEQEEEQEQEQQEQQEEEKPKKKKNKKKNK